MSIVKTNGTWTTPQAVHGGVWSCPLPGQSGNIVLSQPYQIAATSWSAATIGAEHASDSTLYLCDESERVPIGAGMVQWSRTYAKLPAQHTEYETIIYTFPGFLSGGGIGDAYFEGRDPVTEPTTCKTVFDYYLLASGTVSPPKYNTVEGMPIVAAFRPYWTGNTSNYTPLWLANNPPFTVASVPNVTDYLTKVTNGDWIAIEPSQIARWMGNIFVRRTRYVKAT